MALTPLQLSCLAILFEAFFLGIQAVVLAVVIWIWRSRKTPTRVHAVLYTTIVIMFLISATHTALVTTRYMLPSTFGHDVRSQQMITALAIIQYFFGDYVIMWKVWVVWNKNYLMVIVPFCISCTAFAFGFSVLPSASLLDIVSPSLLTGNFVLCTGLIVARILYVNMRSQGSQNILKVVKRSPYRGLIFLLCETGAFYTFIQVAGVIMYQVKSPFLVVGLDFVVPLMGLLPSTIVVLVALDATSKDVQMTVDFTSRLEEICFTHSNGVPGGSEDIETRVSSTDLTESKIPGESLSPRAANSRYSSENPI